MPALNFQARFAEAVESGKKAQTIRKREIKKGSTVYLYTGQRTKACRKLGEGKVLCSLPCAISETGVALQGVPGGKLPPLCVTANDKAAGDPNTRCVDNFAQVDGFVDFEEMLEFFKTVYREGSRENPFQGYLIRWEPNEGAIDGGLKLQNVRSYDDALAAVVGQFLPIVAPQAPADQTLDPGTGEVLGA